MKEVYTPNLRHDSHSAKVTIVMQVSERLKRMAQPRILVTAATGNTGFPTAMQLLEREYPVRAFVRKENERSKALRAMGAEIFIGSLDDIGDVRRALVGVQRAYFCPPILPGLLEKSAIFATSAQEANLEFVVIMTQWAADPNHHSIHTRQHWLGDNVFRQMSGVRSAFVNPGWFADNYLAAPELITQFRLLPMPLGNGFNAPPSNEDISRVVVGILENPALHVGKTYRPTGPKLLSPQEIASALSAATGRKVKYMNVPLKMFAMIGRSLGLPDYTTGQVLHYLADYQRNAFGIGAPTNVVEEIGGRPAEDFETIARRYLAPSMNRTMSTRIGATHSMMMGMMKGMTNLKVISRVDDYNLTNVTYSADSKAWLETHEPIRSAEQSPKLPG